MHELGEKSPSSKCLSSKIHIISHVIFAYLVQLGAGPPPTGRASGAGPPPTHSGAMQKPHTKILGRAHPLKQEKRGPKFTLYCLIQTVMVVFLKIGSHK
jgi:hypothetical protein